MLNGRLGLGLGLTKIGPHIAFGITFECFDTLCLETIPIPAFSLRKREGVGSLPLTKGEIKRG